MKKTILFLLMTLGCVLGVSAQDLIVKIDASQIEAKVTEISPEQIRFKKFTNLEGPTYVLPTREVHYIKFSNGETEYFNREQQIPATPAAPVTPATPESPVTPVTPVAPVAPAVTESAPVESQPAPSRPENEYRENNKRAYTYYRQGYTPGDIYDRDGVRGLVVVVDESGMHGLLMSFDEMNLQWSTFRKPEWKTIGASERGDGAVNMATVEQYIAEHGLSWDNFPAFKWCREKGEGWYLPSIDEMLKIGHNYNGGSRLHVNRDSRSKFNDNLRKSGGERMDRIVYYFTSTEADEKEAFTTHMDLEPPYVVNIPKHNKFLVRAVRKF